ncbi:MAG TPA: AEC family transporter, partial [Arenibaculum sp.]|nr:AEC family transporter [Arenibaculum sp.]
ALIVDNLARADLTGLAFGPMAAALTGAIVTAAALLLASRRGLGLDGPAFTSVLQGAIRPNTFVGIAAASALFGTPGLAIFAIGLATVVPLVNVLSVATLQRYGAGNAGRGFGGVIAALARNPIIIAVVAGVGVNLAGIGGLPVLGPGVRVLGEASLTLGLLAVGAGLDPAAARRSGRGVFIAATSKLLLVPLLTWLIGRSLGLDGMALTVAILFNAVPGAAASYILARQMGGDHRLMASIITVETIVAAATLPLVIALTG